MLGTVNLTTYKYSFTLDLPNNNIGIVKMAVIVEFQPIYHDALIKPETLFIMTHPCSTSPAYQYGLFQKKLVSLNKDHVCMYTTAPHFTQSWRIYLFVFS